MFVEAMEQQNFYVELIQSVDKDKTLQNNTGRLNAFYVSGWKKPIGISKVSKDKYAVAQFVSFGRGHYKISSTTVDVSKSKIEKTHTYTWSEKDFESMLNSPTEFPYALHLCSHLIMYNKKEFIAAFPKLDLEAFKPRLVNAVVKTEKRRNITV